MKSNKNLWIAMAVVTVIAVVSMFIGISVLNKLNNLSRQVNAFGAVGTRFPNGLAVGNASVTTAGGLFVSSAATSTFSILSTSSSQGLCIPLNATSTNTLLNMTFRATSTAATVGNIFPSGIIPVIGYGACL